MTKSTVVVAIGVLVIGFVAGAYLVPRSSHPCPTVATFRVSMPGASLTVDPNTLCVQRGGKVYWMTNDVSVELSLTSGQPAGLQFGNMTASPTNAGVADAITPGTYMVKVALPPPTPGSSTLTSPQSAATVVIVE